MTANRKKAYLALLALGAAALFIDRVFLAESVSAPDVAMAELVPQAERDASTKPGATDAPGIPELHFPPELERYSPTTSIPDLFAEPGQPAGANSIKPDKSEQDEESQVAGARLADLLQGVYVRAHVQYAVIDGRTVKRGENIHGCTLTEISGTRVKFLCVDREVIATVPTSIRPQPR